MTKEILNLPDALRKQMLEHARSELPYEACGIIGGTRKKGALKFYPARNELQSMTRYNIAPEDLFRIMMDLEEKEQELLGIFHSHPATEPYPSERDINQSYYPEAYYLIASFINPHAPELKAFRIINGQEPEEVEIKPT